MSTTTTAPRPGRRPQERPADEVLHQVRWLGQAHQAGRARLLHHGATTGLRYSRDR
jgi:hypothetical protein